MLLKEIHAIENAARIAMASEEDAYPAIRSTYKPSHIGLAILLIGAATYMLLG